MTLPPLPRIGFGAAPLGNLYRAVSNEDARGALEAGLAAGLTYIDTAPYYGFGLSERRVGEAIRGCDVRLSTKVGRRLVPATGTLPPARHGFRDALPLEPVFDYSHDGVLRSFEDSLARLGVPRIDLLYIHDIGRLTHGDAHEARMAELTTGGGLKALERLRAEGTVSGIGVGVNETAAALDVMRHAPLDAILLAGRYTLLDQGALDDLLPACSEAGTRIVVGGPYNSGLLAGATTGRELHYNYAPAPAPLVEQARAIEAVCDRHGVALGAAALQFPLGHPAVASVIPGLASAAEARETAARRDALIPADLWAELKSKGLLRTDAPTP